MRRGVVYLVLLFLLLGCNTKHKDILSNKKSINIPFSVLTWNIQILGKSKFGNKEIMNHIYDIIYKYDIVCIQEERSKESIADDLCKELNAVKHTSFMIAKSEREGRGIGDSIVNSRSISKERYLILYNKNRFVFISSYTLDDVNDLFEREPYCILLADKKTLKHIVIINFHSKPSDVDSEIRLLSSSIDKIVKKFSCKNIIICGDFNTNDIDLSSYFPNSKYSIAFSVKYSWTSNTRKTKLYDNIIFTNNFRILDKNIFDISKMYGKDVALKISDHLPLYAKFVFQD